MLILQFQSRWGDLSSDTVIFCSELPSTQESRAQTIADSPSATKIPATRGPTDSAQANPS